MLLQKATILLRSLSPAINAERRTSNRLLQLLPHQMRLTSYDTSTKTVVTILNEDAEAGLMIDSYSQMGFRLNNGMSAIGPIAVFPKSVLSWNINSAEGITKESLSLFYLIEPKIDILVIGVGDRGNRVSPEVIQYMRTKKINVEVLPTEQACATFNFLNSEKRQVAAAILPPRKISMGDDAFQASALDRKSWLE